METWRLFWAKTNREKVDGLADDWTHPLWAHLIDVGNAALVLWEEFLPPSLKQTIANGIGLSKVEAGQFLSVWIGLHDLGKGIPSFQGIPGIPDGIKQRLESAGFVFHPNANRLHHGHASIAIAQRWLNHKQFNGKTLLHALAAFVGIHHGKLCKSEVWESVAESERSEGALGDAVWKQAQHDLTEAVFMAWGVPLPPTNQFPTLNALQNPWPDWLMAFAGWATLADWLGSMQRCYDLSVRAEDDLHAYVANSREGAKRAFVQAGLNQRANLRALPFADHFGNAPRPLQEITAMLPLHPSQPNLIIVEAPTGEGKTEAGFYLTARHGGGLYVAMPSQSTSDGLFPRLKTFIAGDAKNLKAAHVGETAALRLVHGNDLLHDDAVSLLTIAEATARIDDDDDPKNRTNPPGDRVLGWFMPKKRALLVPYGVGTVDQLFLGVLYAKHFFLRLFALCGKTVIFDEVHAYDAYMNAVFGQLLRWLRALNVNVVVLSATLPGEARQRMLEAWNSTTPADDASQPAPYPVVWHAAADVATTHPFSPAPGRGQRLTFRWCGAEVETMAATARKLLADGATVMVVCNTVQRAQDVFRLLDTDDVLPVEDRMLLHARMPQAWRQDREKAARARFGPKRPNRPGLLVGTQVIEQSLDLDVDAQITDLAPVDLLLQRAGRLHRHKRGHRPKGFTEPALYIACAEAEPGQLPDVAEISGGGKIYETALLWKTWAMLRQVGGWSLPLGNESGPGYRTLIESVYGDAGRVPDGLNADVQAQYQQRFAEWLKQDSRQMADATARLVPQPKKLKSLFVFDKPELAEEDEEGQGTLPEHLRALTRNPDGINAEVLLLHRTVNGWSIEPGGEMVLARPAPKKLHPDTLRALFGAAVRISNAGLVSALWKLENPEWAAVQDKHRVLKRFHLIELTDASAVVGSTRLMLNTRLGLLYTKQSV